MKSITAIFATLCYADFYSQSIFDELCREIDLRVVVVTEAIPERLPPAFEGRVDKFYVIAADLAHDTFDALNVVELDNVIAQEQQQFPERTVRLVCCEEMILTEVGWLRRKWQLEGPYDNELCLFRDKIAMKQRLIAAGIKTPVFSEVNSNTIGMDSLSYDQLAIHFGHEFILKPVDSKGSVAVEKIVSPQDLCAWAEAWKGRLDRVDVEQFLSGDLYHVDSLVQGSEVKFQFASAYAFPVAEFKQGRVLGSITLRENDPIAPVLKKFAGEVLKALGASDMSTHMEIFIVDGEPVFLEVAARPPGGCVANVYRSAYGVNILDLDLLLQLGLPLPSVHFHGGYGFWAYFPTRDGIVAGRHAPALANDYRLEWRVDTGARTYAATNMSQTAGIVVASGNDFESVRNDFEVVIRHNALTMLE
ncbi:acetyl-CoA carboxylase biotin carboxylase subunit family protein [Acidithiobacillus sp. M4-SHS-6]|uniref:ATP-grasp domain-containing protein n=1 Tax=Acidithiobacillus sp. M4-SHS-6 TaxID=3383024 RepID=UPI0039BDF6D8